MLITTKTNRPFMKKAYINQRRFEIQVRRREEERLIADSLWLKGFIEAQLILADIQRDVVESRSNRSFLRRIWDFLLCR